MTVHKLVIEPNTHNGWELEWSKSHDGKSDYRGHKGPRSVFAETLGGLIQACDKADEVTVKFVPPLSVLHKNRYSLGGYKPVNITLLCSGRFVYVDAEGTHEEFLSALRLDSENRERGDWIMDDTKNRGTLSRLRKLQSKREFLRAQTECEVSKLQPLTEADMLITAKSQTATVAKGTP